MEINGSGTEVVGLFGDQNLAVEIDSAVHGVEGFVAHRDAVDVEQDAIAEDAEMDLVPLVGEHLWFLPGERLESPVVLENGEFDGVSLRIESDCELGLSLGVRDPNKVPTSTGLPTVTEGRHEAELLRQALVKNAKRRHD